MTTAASFASLGLDERLLTALTALGYEEPTPIQRAAIPPLLAGNDLLGQAETGTGKTAAFALPMLQRLAASPLPAAAAGKGGRPPRALVLVPTRELAMQVAEAIGRYGQGLGTRVTAIYGGQSFEPQLRALRFGVDVVVATPGRALDHLRRKTLSLASVVNVVLDEADEMLDMGFADDLKTILAELPAAPARQTALFSATLPHAIAEIAKRHLHQPERVRVESELKKGVPPRVRQAAYLVTRHHRLAALLRVLEIERPASALVFCRTRIDVDQLVQALQRKAQTAEALHGGLSQEQRDRVMRRFRGGEVTLLVATDVAARGLDIKGLSHVINYEIPAAPEDYVHRIGRTGRAGKDGVALMLVEPRDQRLLRHIEQLTRQKIDLAPVPSPADLRAKRLERLREAVEEVMKAGGTEAFRALVEKMGGDALEVAAAALKLANDASTGASADDDLDLAVKEKERPQFAPREQKPHRGQGAGAGGERPRPAGPGGDRRGPGAAGGPGHQVTRLWLGVGLQAGVRPADLVGAIANEAGLTSRAIRIVEIAVRHAIVEVPAAAADGVVQALSRTLIRGRKVNARRDRA